MISPVIVDPAELLAAALRQQRQELSSLKLTPEDKEFLAAVGIAFKEEVAL